MLTHRCRFPLVPWEGETRGFFNLRVAPGEVLAEIRAAQVSALFRQMPIALAVNAVNAIITFIVLQQFIGFVRPLAWLCVVLLVTSGRWALWRRYRHARSGIMDVTQWSWLAAGGALLAGMCWGVGGLVLFPIMPALGQIFLTFVIGGMCAGAVVISASHLPSLLAFLLSAGLPMAVLFLGQGTKMAAGLGAMIVVFATSLSLAGLHLNRFFAETMRLRFELGAANLRLQAEIAERETTEAALRQAQKLEAIGQLTGGISHDFNNLLTVVIGNLVLAIERAGESPAIVPLLQGALQAAERGAALIQRLLAFARRQRLDPRSVDLKLLVSEIEDLLRRTLGNRIRLIITAEADLEPARVDANQLELAILNLTINARDAMPDGGNLRICLQNRRANHGSPSELSPGEYVVLSISDTGTGMDEATLARALEPFFTTKEIGSGSGLGLPMVQGFAAQSGGDLRIQSKVGEGTTVELWLPRADEPPSRATNQSLPGHAERQS
ncbi:MAG TPA: ATP-binding protein [Stellaceae bacterium]|nr:ATP-binding protein [Stellaceae bacterium]